MKIICAYPVNVDAVCNIRGEEISALIPPNMKIELKESIGSREDLLSCLLFCMQQGSGAEILIQSRAAALKIEESFSWQFRLGGNAGIMANVLAALGANPVLNAPALGPRLAGMLHARVRVPVSGRLMEPEWAAGDREKEQEREQEADQEMVHFVFQFKKGDEVDSEQSRIIAPRDNRFIATYDPVNARLLSSRHFDSYCRENIREIDGALLSGFHLAPVKEHREIFPKKIAQIKSWKEKNPQIFIHAEMGSFQNPEIMKYLLLFLLQIPVDSLGLNEDELTTAEGSVPGRWQEKMRAAERLRESLGLFRVAVHTRDYILSVMLKGRITALEELSALKSGSEAAAALAATSFVTGEPPDEVNPVGLEAKEEFCHYGAKVAGRGAFLQTGDEIISFMPSLLAKNPKITVGLGDTATAAVFFRELRAIKGN